MGYKFYELQDHEPEITQHSFSLLISKTALLEVVKGCFLVGFVRVWWWIDLGDVVTKGDFKRKD